jgi:hypothetical protein
MVPTCQLVELMATARTKSEGGTRCAVMALPTGALKARATPNTTSTAYSGRTSCTRASVSASSASEHTRKPPWHSSSTRRRSKRSATCPPSRLSTTKGTNWARPT